VQICTKWTRYQWIAYKSWMSITNLSHVAYDAANMLCHSYTWVTPLSNEHICSKQAPFKKNNLSHQYKNDICKQYTNDVRQQDTRVMYEWVDMSRIIMSLIMSLIYIIYRYVTYYNQTFTNGQVCSEWAPWLRTSAGTTTRTPRWCYFRHSVPNAVSVSTTGTCMHPPRIHTHIRTNTHRISRGC